eukprot:COSAG06_NODE_21205_length_766_cov_0.758621_1_plen_42_part_10
MRKRLAGHTERVDQPVEFHGVVHKFRITAFRMTSFFIQVSGP